MKNLLFSVALSALAITTATAQDGPIGVRKSSDYASGSSSDSRNNGFGVKGGVNFANFRGSDASAYKDLSSYKAFHAGVYAQFGFNDKFSLQPEVLYSRQGYRGSAPGTAGSTQNNRLDYVQIPVLLVFNVLDNVSLHLGPQVSLLTKVKEGDLDRKIANEKDPATGNYPYSYSYNSLDYGLSAGVETRLGPARIGGRYTAGFADVIKDPIAGYNQSVADVKNGLFQVYVGVGINN